MWNLSSLDLPTTKIKNNATVTGLELLELGNLEIKSPLFKFSFRPGELGDVNDTPIVDLETSLDPETTSFVYVISNIWNFSSLEFVDSINKLDDGKYTHYFGETILISNELSLVGDATFFAYVPTPNNSNIYEIDLTGTNIESIDLVEVGGLPFRNGASQTFIFDEETSLLTLVATDCCKPKINSVAEIFSSKTFILSGLSKSKVYIFDLSSLDINYVTYMDYLGKSYSISSSLQSGTLVNNYEERKVLLFEGIT